jgi:hypothetical protein
VNNLYTIWRVLCSVALSCALNGVGVAMVTLVILAWNNCRPSTAPDNVAYAQNIAYTHRSGSNYTSRS